jgi:VanZ family protein
MAASPVASNASSIALRSQPMSQQHSLRIKWFYVLLSLIFVACTSTTYFGGIHTGALLNAVWRAVLGSWHYDLRGIVNLVLRKIGHFFGYGMIGLIFRNAWYTSLRALTSLVRSWVTPFAAMLAVSSTFMLACLDEWHQRYVPGRVSSFRDVLVDTTGALLLNVIYWNFRAYRRRRLQREF